MKFIIGFLLGFLLATSLVVGFEDLSLEPLFNRVYNSTTDTISVEGQ